MGQVGREEERNGGRGRGKGDRQRQGHRQTGRSKRGQRSGTPHTQTNTGNSGETCQAITSPAVQKAHCPHLLPPAGWTGLGPMGAVSSEGTRSRGCSPRTGHPTGAGPSLMGGANGGPWGGLKVQTLLRWPGPGPCGDGLGLVWVLQAPGHPQSCPLNTHSSTLPRLIHGLAHSAGTRSCPSAAHCPCLASENRLPALAPQG